MLYALMIVIVVFFIVDSLISYYLVKDMEEYKTNFYKEFHRYNNMLHDDIFFIRDSLCKDMSKLETLINKSKRTRKKKTDGTK